MRRPSATGSFKLLAVFRRSNVQIPSLNTSSIIVHRLYACPIATHPNAMKTVNDVLAGVLEASLYRYLNRRYGELQHEAAKHLEGNAMFIRVQDASWTSHQWNYNVTGMNTERRGLLVFVLIAFLGLQIAKTIGLYMLEKELYYELFRPLSMQKLKVPPHPLSPMGDACSRMDLTAIHQILVMTHYNDDDGTNETIKLDDEQYLGVAICTLSQVSSLYPLDVSIAS
ncbi:hypothetical protein Tco_0109184 [Tanacetum coccineum]